MKKQEFLESFERWYEEYGGKNPEYYTPDVCLYWLLQNIGMLGEEAHIYTLFDAIETIYIWYTHVVDGDCGTCEDFAEASWLFMETYSFDCFSSHDSWSLISRILKYAEIAYSIIKEGNKTPLTASNYLELLAGTCTAWFFELAEEKKNDHDND